MAFTCNAVDLASKLGVCNLFTCTVQKSFRQFCSPLDFATSSDGLHGSRRRRRLRIHEHTTAVHGNRSCQSHWRCRAVSEKDPSSQLSKSSKEDVIDYGHPIPVIYARTGQPATAEQVGLEQVEAAKEAVRRGLGLDEASLADHVDDESFHNLLALEAWCREQGISSIVEDASHNGALGLQDSVSSEQGNTSSRDSEQAAKEENWWTRLQNSVSPRVRGLILLNLLTFLYGSNIAVIKEAEEALPPAAFSFGRFIIATIAFVPFIGAAFKEKTVRNAGLELGFWGAMGYLTQAIAVTDTDAGRASFISTFTVIEVPIIAGLFGAKIPKVTWASAAAAICGVGLLETTNGHTSLTGDLWTFASALFFGIHMLRSEHHSKHLAHNAALPLIGLQLATISTFAAVWGVVEQVQGPDHSFLQSALAGDWPSILASLQTVPWFPMVYTGLMSTALCLWIEVVSLRDVSATEAAMVYTLEPLYGAGFAWVLLGERWGLKGWVGAALILGGSLAMQLLGKETQEPLTVTPPLAKRAATALGVAAVATALAAAASPKGSLLPEEAAQQAALLADTVDLDNFATLLRIYALTIMDGGEREE